MEILTKSAKETKALGKKIASKLKGGETLALVGELGSGKTTFVQGLVKGLGIDKRVISPTFILMRKYDIPISHQPLTISHFYHVDLYRLEENVRQEFKNLGVDDMWGRKGNIVAIEWAEKIKNMVPKNATWIEFENLGGGKRKITVGEV